MKSLRMFVMMAALALPGCGLESFNLNEGSNRLALVDPPNAKSQSTSVSVSSYYSKEDNPGAVIKKGEIFQIKLISAFICNFRETDLRFDALSGSNIGASPCRSEPFLGGESAGVATRGEIAVMAGLTRRGRETESAGERVIFFSNDVRETGQLLNFANLPVYGPAVYEPVDLTLSLKILELDQDETQSQQAFLNSVADAGASISSPIYGGAFSLLVDIGRGFLASNLDDVEMAFTVGFDVPPDETSMMPRLSLREGYLVLMRRENRSTYDHFKNVYVCSKGGFLADDEKNCESGIPYNKATWLLLRVTKENATVVRAELAGRLLNDIRNAGYVPDAAALEEGVKGLVVDDAPGDDAPGDDAPGDDR